MQMRQILPPYALLAHADSAVCHTDCLDTATPLKCASHLQRWNHQCAALPVSST